MLTIGNLTLQAGLYNAVYGILFIIFTICVIATFNRIKSAKVTSVKPQEKQVTLLIVLFLAVVFRLTTILIAPTLSTDQFRYTWEGRLITLGFSPYRYPPLDPKLITYRDNFWPLVQQKETTSPYPPVAQVLAVGEYLTMGENLLGPKIVAAFFDLLTCLALLWLLGIYGLDKRRVILYAWCPLPILEFGQSGHNDAPMLFFTLLALGLTAKRKPGTAALILGIACLAKFTPLFVLPLFLVSWQPALLRNPIKGKWNALNLLSWRVLRYPLLTILVVIIGYIPFLVLGKGALGSILEYSGGWRDNDSLLFSFLNDLLGSFPAKLITVMLLGVGVFLLAFHPLLSQSLSLPRRIMLVYGIVLMVASTVHPWYLTWIVVLLPLIWGEVGPGDFTFSWWDSAWLFLSALVELPYLTYAGDGSAYIWVRPLEYLPLHFAVILSCIKFYSLRKQKKAILIKKT